MTTLPRDLDPEERLLLDLLLNGDWSGAAEARSQLKTAKHKQGWFEGSHSFDLIIDPHLPLVAQPDGILPATERNVYEGGAYVGGVMIWLKDGRISSLEYYWTTDDMPAQLPKPHQIRTY